ncbi:unnamed protein product [Moneuplotes crassus]|uniref:Uncharacterized protein n=1 Tax=Euplotes crassus TaxID=5936 RepID=A0AAD1U2L4_EUPCR|nr:unnamed protein product [Moneuplotes crassus]
MEPPTPTFFPLSPSSFSKKSDKMKSKLTSKDGRKQFKGMKINIREFARSELKDHAMKNTEQRRNLLCFSPEGLKDISPHQVNSIHFFGGRENNLTTCLGHCSGQEDLRNSSLPSLKEVARIMSKVPRIKARNPESNGSELLQRILMKMALPAKRRKRLSENTIGKLYSSMLSKSPGPDDSFGNKEKHCCRNQRFLHQSLDFELKKKHVGQEFQLEKSEKSDSLQTSFIFCKSPQAKAKNTLTFKRKRVSGLKEKQQKTPKKRVSETSQNKYFLTPKNPLKHRKVKVAVKSRMSDKKQTMKKYSQKRKDTIGSRLSHNSINDFREEPACEIKKKSQNRCQEEHLFNSTFAKYSASSNFACGTSQKRKNSKKKSSCKLKKSTFKPANQSKNVANVARNNVNSCSCQEQCQTSSKCRNYQLKSGIMNYKNALKKSPNLSPINKPENTENSWKIHKNAVTQDYLHCFRNYKYRVEEAGACASDELPQASSGNPEENPEIPNQTLNVSQNIQEVEIEEEKPLRETYQAESSTHILNGKNVKILSKNPCKLAKIMMKNEVHNTAMRQDLKSNSGLVQRNYGMNNKAGDYQPEGLEVIEEHTVSYSKSDREILHPDKIQGSESKEIDKELSISIEESDLDSQDSCSFNTDSDIEIRESKRASLKSGCTMGDICAGQRIAVFPTLNPTVAPRFSGVKASDELSKLQLDNESIKTSNFRVNVQTISVSSSCM